MEIIRNVNLYFNIKGILPFSLYYFYCLTRLYLSQQLPVIGLPLSLVH